MRPFTNEQHDIAAAEASAMGVDVPHVEEQRQAAEEVYAPGALLMHILRECVAVDVPCSDGMATSLERMGARFVMMALSAGAGLRLNANERRRVRALTADAFDRLMLRPCEAAVRVCGFIAPQEMDLRGMGRRLTLLGYAFDRSPMMRDALPSMERIGRLWQLRAENVRSAVCAAFVTLKEELIDLGRMPKGFRFWFEKSADAKAVYATVQEGNQNRLGHVGPVVESWQGIPLKREWQRLSAKEREERLERMWRGGAADDLSD